MTRSSSQTRTSPFYVKTQEALQAKEYVEASKQRDADGVGSRLKAAADDARKAAEKKGSEYIDSVTGGDADKAPRGRYNKDGKQQPLEGVAAVGGSRQDKTPAKENETEDYHEAETELNSILKKSPSTSPFPFPLSAPNPQLTPPPQSSSSPKPTARTPARPNTSSSKSTTSSPRPTSSSSTSTPSASSSKRSSPTPPAAGPCLTSWSSARASAAATRCRSSTRQTPCSIPSGR